MADKRFFVVDMMPLLYRGHFAFLKHPRLTASGISTGALLGFANSITQIIKDYNPTHIALAMDPDGPTFRHEIYPAYKAGRDKMPEDLASNIPYAFELAEALNIKVVRIPRFEADDVIGTLALKALSEGYEVYIVTPDKDASQLLKPGMKLFRPGKAGGPPEILDEQGVCEHWQIESPAKMLDYLALAGDSADNIPGIRGVGPKTAVQLLKDFGSLEGVLSAGDALSSKLREKVAQYADDARLSKVLAEIKTDVPVESSIDDFVLKNPDNAALAAVCAKYELNALARRWGVDAAVKSAPAPRPVSSAPDQLDLFDSPAPGVKTINDVPHDYKLVSTFEEAKALAEELSHFSKIAFDTETTGLDVRACRPVGMSFAVAPGKAWYVAVPEDEEAVKKTVGVFAPLFADTSKIFIAHNAKFDMAVLRRFGISFASAPRDTMLEHYVLNAADRHNLDSVSREVLQYDPIPIEELIGEKKRGAGQLNMADIPPEKILDYAAEDADVAFRLDAALRPEAAKCGLEKVLAETEEPLVGVLAEMEETGIRIDTAALKEYGRALNREILSLVQEIISYGNPGLNVNSPKQLAELLYGKLGLSSGKGTSSGVKSTDEATLAAIADEHPVVRKILDYRACTKLKSTYIDKLLLSIDPCDGRVHTDFSQAFTETGRLSSRNPNLQNIPIRTQRGKPIRAAFVARDENHLLVSCDYSQIELRIMAAMSGDEAMLSAFASGADIHRDTAARVYGISPEAVTPEQRSACKMVNFGIIYGISAFGLSQRLGIPRKEAAFLIETYFKLYPKVKEFMDRLIGDARATGYAATLTGRRRFLRDISSRNAMSRQAAERDAINTPVQGTAADLIKAAMVKIDRAFKNENLKSKMVLQIHDELLFDVPVEEEKIVLEIARREMEGAMDLGVPLSVSAGSGRNWLEAH